LVLVEERANELPVMPFPLREPDGSAASTAPQVGDGGR